MTRNIFFLCGLLCILISCNNVNSKNDKKKEQESISDTISLTNTKESGKDYLEIGFELMKNEEVGGIKTNLTFEKITQILGEPEEKTEPEFSNVDGWYYQAMNYKSKGLYLIFKINTDSVKTVENILLKDPCVFKTSRQIGIGSSYEEVEKAYKDYINPEFSDEESIVTGSIYGGIVFTLENKKVKTIYIGISGD